ncbi:hypothetical protein ACG2LH_04410 [Zhouia sp. PK063]|uniref:hypothetical protein n=1 Tax=Zhouia sp. PK063 TaxID=3373602 RepID=UPI0037B6665E
MKFLYILILFFCSNCDTNNVKQKYDILSLIYGDLAKPIKPALPFQMMKEKNGDWYFKTEKDSLNFSNFKNKIESDPIIVAISTIQNNWQQWLSKEHIQKDIPTGFEQLYEKFKKTYQYKKGETITLSNIKKERQQDSIIPFHDSLIRPDRKDYDQFYMLISFSKVVFNEEQNKAIVLVAMSRSKLDGVSGIYFLRKENGIWKQEKYIGLFIS